MTIRLELLEVMQRIELPVSPPAFGCQDNVTNIKRALISGFFLNVSVLLAQLVDALVLVWIVCSCLPLLRWLTMWTAPVTTCC